MDMMLEKWNVTEFCGYIPQTTFWEDFFIAEQFGEKAILDTYKRAMKHWKHDYVYLTELVMVLNHKIWRYYDKNEEYAKLYDMLWEKTKEYAHTHLKGEELDYFLQVTD